MASRLSLDSPNSCSETPVKSLKKIRSSFSCSASSLAEVALDLMIGILLSWPRIVHPNAVLTACGGPEMKLSGLVTAKDSQ